MIIMTEKRTEIVKEPKVWKQDQQKWLDKLKEKLKVLYSKEMKPILKYVEEKYGVDFIKLYRRVSPHPDKV